MAQIKEQIKAPEKNTTKWRRDSQPSNAQFKTLVIRKLTELVEYDRKIQEKVKAMKSEIKENVKRTNSDGKETGTQINGLEQREKETLNQNRMKK